MSRLLQSFLSLPSVFFTSLPLPLPPSFTVSLFHPRLAHSPGFHHFGSLRKVVDTSITLSLSFFPSHHPPSLVITITTPTCFPQQSVCSSYNKPHASHSLWYSLCLCFPLMRPLTYTYCTFCMLLSPSH